MVYFDLLVLLFLNGIVAATTVADLPSCALGCYAQAVGNTSCGATDSYVIIDCQ